jgi:3-isopropylmalate dehydrogenase
MKATIAVLPGDGIGPEVIAEGVRVLETVAQLWNHDFDLREGWIGGAAIDREQNPLPPDTQALCEDADAVLLGAVGGPKWSDPAAALRPEQGLLRLRLALRAFANLRPVRPHPALQGMSPLKPELLAGVDLLFVRELTGGLYVGESRTGRASDGGERVVDECVYTTGEVERVVRVAAELALSRRRRITSIDKANVLATSRLWRRTTTRVIESEFAGAIELEHMLVDSATIHLLRRPADFDVIVLENMFGDILTDEASVLAGSIGVLPSASIGAHRPGELPRGIYEPIHGSAPDLTGKQLANPIGTILSVALLLRYSLGLHEEAHAIETAVDGTLSRGIGTPDIAGGAGIVGTAELSEEVIRSLRDARDPLLQNVPRPSAAR